MSVHETMLISSLPQMRKKHYASTTCLKIDLRYNLLGDAGAKELGKQLKNWNTLTDVALLLQHNNIGQAGATELAAGIKSLDRLETLQICLRWNEIGEDAAGELIHDIFSNCRNLKNLSIDIGSACLGKRGAVRLAEAFNEGTNHLKSLNNQLGSEGLKSISTCLRNSTCITNLSLSLKENFIGANDVQYLQSFVDSCRNLQFLQLDLFKNNLRDEGASQLAEILKSKGIKNLQLNLESNKLTSEGVLSFCRTLSKNKYLATLELNLLKNTIDVAHAQQARYVIQKSPRLVHMKMIL